MVFTHEFQYVDIVDNETLINVFKCYFQISNLAKIIFSQNKRAVIKGWNIAKFLKLKVLINRNWLLLWWNQV